MSQSTTYQIIHRLDEMRTYLERGQSLNCTDIAAKFGTSTKTAQRYVGLLRDHYRMQITYDASMRVFSLAAPAVAPATDLERLVDVLRQRDRLKVGCDYAVTRKYGESHLLCREVFLKTILERAAECGIVFSTVAGY